jgi:hypothetical protein
MSDARQRSGLRRYHAHELATGQFASEMQPVLNAEHILAHALANRGDQVVRDLRA